MLNRYRICLCVLVVAFISVNCHSAIGQSIFPRSSHSGLLGKTYVQGMRLDFPIETPGPFGDRFIDSSADGFNIAANLPISWLSSQLIATDLYGEYERIDWSSRNVDVTETELEDISLGGRLILFPSAKLRPFAGVGALLRTSTVDINGSEFSQQDVAVLEFRAGLEIDFRANVSARAEYRFADSDPLGLDSSRIDALITWWGTANFYTMGGIIVPLGDEFEPSTIFGGGLVF